MFNTKKIKELGARIDFLENCLKTTDEAQEEMVNSFMALEKHLGIKWVKEESKFEGYKKVNKK